RLTTFGFVPTEVDAGADTGVPLQAAWPLYDGKTLVFFVGSEGCPETVKIFADGQFETLRSPSGMASPCFVPHYHVAVAGGYVAYLQQSTSSGAYQLWMRAPSGIRKNVAPLSQNAIIEALNDSGQAMIKVPADPLGTQVQVGKMYLADWNGAP